jgi:hypothetical protein
MMTARTPVAGDMTTAHITPECGPQREVRCPCGVSLERERGEKMLLAPFFFSILIR